MYIFYVYFGNVKLLQVVFACSTRNSIDILFLVTSPKLWSKGLMDIVRLKLPVAADARTVAMKLVHVIIVISLLWFVLMCR